MRIFADRGYHRATLYDIGRAARCSEDKIVELFRSKADLLVAAFRAAHAEKAVKYSSQETRLFSAISSGNDFEGAIRDWVDIIYLSLDKQYIRMRTFGYLERPDLMRELWKEIMQRYYEAVGGMLRMQRTKGLVRKDVNVEVAAAALFFMCAYRRVYEHMGVKLPGLNLSRRDMRYFSDIWMHGVLTTHSSVHDEE